MIEYAVRQHFPDLPVTSGPLPYSRNYLEKLVQVPFRIPALGGVETPYLCDASPRTDARRRGASRFRQLVLKARDTLDKPWLGRGLSQSDIRTVDDCRQPDLDTTFVLAQQIAPILAEGTKGNPRQVKRFLNALLVRQTIAEARGFGDLIERPVLAKLMLAERFQPRVLRPCRYTGDEGSEREIGGCSHLGVDRGGREQSTGEIDPARRVRRRRKPSITKKSPSGGRTSG